MLLHNQTKSPITWTGGGNTYSWEPFGSCDVPDRFFAAIRAEGFPVDITPVTPQQKAQVAIDEETERTAASEVVRLKKRLATLEADVSAAKEAAESARAGELAATTRADTAEERVRVLTEQLSIAASQATEYDKLLAEAGAEQQKLRNQIDGMRVKLGGKKGQ